MDQGNADQSDNHDKPGGIPIQKAPDKWRECRADEPKQHHPKDQSACRNLEGVAPVMQEKGEAIDRDAQRCALYDHAHHHDVPSRVPAPGKQH